MADQSAQSSRYQPLIPTYNANLYARETEEGILPEFGAPHVAVLVEQVDGLRIVLGSHKSADQETPTIHVERQPNGWAIFLHPLGDAGDSVGVMYFHDNGSCFLVRDNMRNLAYEIRIVNGAQDIPGFHCSTARKSAQPKAAS